MRLIIDLHVHTNSSHDSTITPIQLLEQMRFAGINAVAITDHDTMEGYKRIRNSSAFKDMIILPGVEVSTELGDLIILGLENPTIMADPFKVVEAARDEGGFILAPHPFDERRVSVGEKVSILNVDAIETVNAKCSNDANRQAREFARALRLPAVGGSDAHEKSQVGSVVNVLECERDVGSIMEGLRRGAKIVARGKSAMR